MFGDGMHSLGDHVRHSNIRRRECIFFALHNCQPIRDGVDNSNMRTDVGGEDEVRRLVGGEIYSGASRLTPAFSLQLSPSLALSRLPGPPPPHHVSLN